MNPMLAAGLFDSPWVVAAIVIIGAFINWLSQLRQQKQQRDEERRAREGESESPPKPQGDFDLEETVKRWLGEETTPAPPPVPRSPNAPPPVWEDRVVPPVIVPPVVASLPVRAVRAVSEAQKQAAARLAQAGHAKKHHLDAARVHRRHGSQWSDVWRNRPSMRRAFVSSLVFGPPKGLES